MKLKSKLKISWMVLKLGFLIYTLTIRDNETEEEFAPIVTLPGLGQVKGIVQEAANGGHIHLYQGIRYGRANRFELPTFAEPWPGTYEATTPRESCPQLGLDLPGKGFLTSNYSEDCLYLNVWSPAEKKVDGPGRPVMVYIFGGAFRGGSIFKLAHDARYMAQNEDVILVALEYRVGPFGFLFGGKDSGAAANLGLHDQILGLKWVREYIRHFGGDPDRVTIFGNSSGSVCVGVLLLSPLARGLFQRAIIQSGVPIGMIGAKSQEDTLVGTRAFAERLDCTRESSKAMVECFKSRTVEQLLEAAKNLKPDPICVTYGDLVLPVRPVEALLTGQYNANVDLLYGVVRDEGTYFVGNPTMYPELCDQDFVIDIPKAREYIVQMIGQSWGEMAADFYIQRANLGPEPSQSELRLLISKAFGDYVMTCPVILFGELFWTNSPPERRIYSWMLTRPAEVHIVGFCNDPKTRSWLGVCHADDLFYLFTIPKQSKPEDRVLSKEIIKAWVSFAQTGEPGLAMGEIPWTPALTKTPGSTTRFMALDYQSRMVSGHYRETCHDFWKAKLIF